MLARKDSLQAIWFRYPQQMQLWRSRAFDNEERIRSKYETIGMPQQHRQPLAIDTVRMQNLIAYLDSKTRHYVDRRRRDTETHIQIGCSSIKRPTSCGVMPPNGSIPPCAQTIFARRSCLSNRSNAAMLSVLAPDSEGI